jgi:hypothetical protein
MSGAIAMSAADRGRSLRLSAYAPLLTVVAAAAALRAIGHLDTDVSWLITLGEKTLLGRRPYIDFLEVNPPASILLYLPAVAAARLAHVPAELAVNLCVFLIWAASFALCASIIRGSKLENRRNLSKRSAAAAFILLILPSYAFAQREHLALLLMLPMLCLHAVRAAEGSPRISTAWTAGLAAGIAIAIKPHFILAPTMSLAYVLWRQRGEAGAAQRLVLSPEHLTGLGLIVFYAGVVAFAFPAFLTNELPLLLALYVKVSRPFPGMLENPSCLLFAAGAAATIWFARERLREPALAIPLLAAFGFILSAIIQSKGWPYHGYPAVALVLFCIGDLVLTCPPAKNSVALVAIYALLATSSTFWFSVSAEKPAVLEALQRKHLEHPKILAIAGDIAVGHPLTRLLKGVWAGTACSLWVTQYADILRSTTVVDAAFARKLARFEAFDRATLLGDIRRNRPDVILVDGQHWRRWALSNRVIAAALAAYRRDETVDGVEIWLRTAKIGPHKPRRALNAAESVPSSR